MRGRLNRRGALGVLSAAGGSAWVGLASATARATEHAAAAATHVDARLTAAELLVLEPLLKDRVVVPLRHELVRNWRDGLAREYAAAGRLEFLVRWDHVALLHALAREAGGRASHRRIAAGLFAVHLAAPGSPV